MNKRKHDAGKEVFSGFIPPSSLVFVTSDSISGFDYKKLSIRA